MMKKLLADLSTKYNNTSFYFPNGKDSFEEGLKAADLNVFADYEEAYTKLMIDLTALCITSIQLVVPKNDDTEILYVSGGFARNPIFIHLLKSNFTGKKVLISEIDNSSALGAALVIADTLSDADVANLELGIKE